MMACFFFNLKHETWGFEQTIKLEKTWGSSCFEGRPSMKNMVWDKQGLPTGYKILVTWLPSGKLT